MEKTEKQMLIEVLEIIDGASSIEIGDIPSDILQYYYEETGNTDALKDMEGEEEE
jgi:hypothetical protein